MAKSKHGATHDEHADESWLLPYSDMMTLLLALFVVMFAMSSVNESKFNAMMESMYTAFGGTTVEGSVTVLPYPDAGLPGNPDMPPVVGSTPNPEPTPSNPVIGRALSNLYLSLNEYVEENGLASSIAVEYQGDKVLVTMKNDVFFQTGSAELSPEMVDKAKQLGKLLYGSQDPNLPFDVIVAGHTDNVPIRTAQYPSNWYLSMQRAVNFLVELLSDSGLDPTRFSSRGYGEYAPIASNETEEGKQQNRRVELLVSENVEQATESSQGTPAPTPAVSTPVPASTAAPTGEAAPTPGASPE